MSRYDSSEIARMHYEAFNNRQDSYDFDKGAELVSDDVEWTNVATGETYRGRQGYREFLRGWATALPDCKVEITNIFSSGEWVTVEFHGRGTHTGPLKTKMGVIPPTGRWVDLSFCEIMQVRDDKIVCATVYFDVATLMDQLGLMEQKAA